VQNERAKFGSNSCISREIKTNKNVSLRSGVGDFYKVRHTAYIYKKLTGKVFTN